MLIKIVIEFKNSFKTRIENYQMFVGLASIFATVYSFGRIKTKTVNLWLTKYLMK